MKLLTKGNKIAIGFDRETLESLYKKAHSDEKDYDDCACWLFLEMDNEFKQAIACSVINDGSNE